MLGFELIDCFVVKLFWTKKFDLNARELYITNNHTRDIPDDLSHVYITCQPFANNNPLCLPIKTTYRLNTDSQWNEWIQFPIPLSILLPSTQIAFTLWNPHSPRNASPIASSTFSLFGKNKTMRRATHRLILWPGVQADGNSPTSTPSKISTQSDLDRLEKFMRKYDRGDLQKDELAFKQLESIRNRFLKESDKKYMYIELPIFDFPIVFNEKVLADDLTIKEYLYPNQITLRELDANLITVFDSEVPQDNPVENKHRKLARSHRNGPLDRELKPNAKLRDEIIDILRYPPTKILSDLEKDLLWKFRFYLTRYKKAITKFLKCVLWHDPVESKQAAELLGLWVDIDVEDALELLGPSFTDSNVRSFAVAQLGSAADDELQLYLLQLVQALKFEKLDQKSGIFDSPLARFLIERGIANPILGNALHWNLMVECEDKVYGRTFGRVVYKFLETMLESPEGINRKDNLRRQGELVATLSDLSKRFRTSKEARPRKVLERYRLDLTDEEAIKYCETLINQSIAAYFPQIMEKLHQFLSSDIDRMGNICFKPTPVVKVQSIQKLQEGGGSQPLKPALKTDNVQKTVDYQYYLSEKDKEPKILILGTSDSGKSTFLKQLKILHGAGFTSEEIQKSKLNILYNLTAISQKVISESKSEDLNAIFASLVQFRPSLIYQLKYLDEHVANNLIAFWADEAMKAKFYELGSIFPVSST
ncbi:Phosphatidylinositol (PI) 3-kinase [Globomyces sp. JEL0801]|nr:Phosphatidylinositol (PI) 3-kinase [Globomyces sp. JEL0801]